MVKKLPRLAIASAIVTASAIMGTPAFAGTLSGATIGGTNPTDYLIYDANSTNTFEVAKTPANLAKVLGGDSNHPTGNVELAASSEKAGFDFTKTTSLSGTIGGKAITLSSLTKDDWNSAYKGTTFGQYWFGQALTQNGLGSLAGTSAGLQMFNIFKTYGGFERFSDPNISYVNQNDTTGEIQVGLAGHLNANTLITKSLDAYLANLPGSASTQQSKATIAGLKTQLGATPIQASEVFKYSYNGVVDYGFGFSATQSNLVEKSDGISHSGNYEIKIKGVAPIKKHVPEPSALLGLVGLGSLLALKRHRLKKA